MAKFYSYGNSDVFGLKIITYPLGWRGTTICGWKPLKGIPYISQTTIPFACRIEYPIKVGEDLRELVIFKGEPPNEKTIVHISPEKNNENEHTLKVYPVDEHDDQSLSYYLWFPQKSKYYKIVYSFPFQSNWWTIFILGVISTLILAVIGGWILFMLGWI